MNFEYTSINDLDQSASNLSNYGKFGINTAKLLKFEFTSQGGSAGNTQDALLVTFKVEDGEYNHRIFPAKVFGISDTNSEEYKKALEKAENQVSKAISQITEAIVGNSSTIASAITASRPTTFKDFVELMERLIKATPNWNNKELDLFLNWQAKPAPNKTRTYLEVPRQTILNFTNSVFVTEKKPGLWTEDTSNGALVYRNTDGAIHPIKRDRWFMGTNHAQKIDTGSNESAQAPTSAPANDNW